MKKYTYGIYGKMSEWGDEDFRNAQTFTGAMSEGGDVYYMNARFYDANTQRFLSQDTYKGNAWELGCLDEQQIPQNLRPVR